MIKISTGVKGLDEMLNGGFPKGRVILLCGGPGAGKTLFSLQFLAAAAERGEPGVYVTLEEPIHFILENVQDFRWDVAGLEKSRQLALLDFFSVSYGDSKTKDSGANRTLSIIDEVVGTVQEIKAEHVVIDPLTSIAIQEQMVYMKRQKIAQFLGVLRDLGCTSLLTSEISSSEGEFYLEEFLADGVIRLEKTLRNFNLIKTVRIEKMRGVKYDEQPKRYVIDERGVYVYSTEPAVV